MRVQIEARKIEEEQSLLKFRELRIERAAVFGQHRPRLFEILLVVENAVREGLGIFRNALRMVLANFFRQIARVTGGRGNRQRRIRRVNIDRRNV